MPAEDISIRDATGDDEAFLWSMLTASVHAEPPWSVDQARATPGIAHYLSGWPRPTDLGVIAVSGDVVAMGAAWLRSFDAGDPGYGHVALAVPELAMAVVPAARGAGIGTRLLGALLDRARSAGVEQVSLSVDPTNVVARRLYDRFAFVPADVEPDPGGSLALVVTLTGPSRPL